MEHTFAYHTVGVRDLKARKETDPSNHRKEIVRGIEVDGEDVKPSQRFWISLGARYGFSPSIFKWFDHEEVFDRISERAASDRIRVTIETSPDGRKTLLGATNPGKPLVGCNNLLELLDESHTEDVDYDNGIITSTHKLRRPVNFLVGDDEHQQQFTMSTPIDGYGQPNIYLSLLRTVCSNGMIAMAKAFRTSLTLGRGQDDVMFSIERALSSFNNEEGFHALRQRIESSGKSWASLYESYTLAQILQKAILDGSITNGDDVGKSYTEKTGDLSTIYGLAQMTELSKKRMKTLPCKATVYDLINFATECATHHCKDQGYARRFQSWCGDVISQEYDLENTLETYAEFNDWWSPADGNQAQVQATVSNN
jgi:hypothetical protein